MAVTILGWVLAALGLAVATHAFVTGRQALRMTRAEHEAWTRRHRRQEAERAHGQRLLCEQAALPDDPWPSGRTWTDEEDVVHSVPAGFFAVTMCGLPIAPSNAEAPEVVDRYPYNRAIVDQTNCVDCLAKEDGC